MERYVVVWAYLLAITLGPCSALAASITGGGGGGGAQGLGPQFNASGGNVVSGVTEAKKLEIRGSGGQATSGVNIYQHSSGRLIIKPVVNDVEGDADIYTELASGRKWGVKGNDGLPKLEIVGDTGVASALNFNCEDSGVSCTVYYKLCGGDLVGVDPATGTAGHIWDKSPLGTAPTATAITGSNQTYGVARFPDSDGDYGVQLTCTLPSGFTGNVDAVAWGKTAGAGNFRLQLATKCYTTDATNDAAFNTASVYTMAAGTSGRLNRYSLTNITKTGCNADNLMHLRAFRNRTEASDSLNNTFDLKSLEIWVRNTY